MLPPRKVKIEAKKNCLVKKMNILKRKGIVNKTERRFLWH